MSHQELIFLLELLMSSEERQLLAVLRDDPGNLSARKIYTDYLLDRGRDQSAELVRAGWTPAGVADGGLASEAIASGSVCVGGFPVVSSGGITISGLGHSFVTPATRKR